MKQQPITKFIHNVQLNTTTVYDFLNSAIEITPYLQLLKRENQLFAPWVGNKQLFGLQKFLVKCQTYQFQPVIGLRFRLKIDNFFYQTVWYARTLAGYKNLLQITQKSYQSDFLDWETVRHWTNGCNLVFCYQNADNTPAIIHLKQQSWWKLDTCYIGCEKLPTAPILASFATEIIPFQPVRYLTTTEQTKFRTLLAIKQQILLKQIPDQSDYSWQTNRQLEQQFPNVIFFQNLNRFCQQIKLKLPLFAQIQIKPFLLPNKATNQANYLWQRCQTELIKQFGNDHRYLTRLKYEFEVVVQQKWIDYFLIVADYIAFARNQDILVGPGRGSACGSLICYLLKITTVDPLRYQLIFERFLNPKLLQKPDIDTDFEDEKRSMIIDYLFKKYGNQHVAQISTFQTIGARMAIRDVGRILEIPLDVINKICQAIERHSTADFLTKITKSYLLQKYQREYPKLFELAIAIINLPRQNGIHAAGIILVEPIISQLLPCFNDSQQWTVVQLDMYDIQALGLIKMDLLGLRNLNLIQTIKQQIEQHTHTKIQLEQISLQDKLTFQLLSTGDTLGIFQLETAGMQKLITKIKPTSLEDIATTISLYRPGPIEHTKLLLERKHHKTTFHHLVPAFETILKNTYGIPLYQEQIILLVQQFAKFSLAEADQLRRAISKKNHAQISDLKTLFFQKSQAAKHSLITVEQVWKLIAKFVGYGFNRSHAIAYSIITYWMAYLKRHYREYFYLAVLNKNIHDQTKTQTILLELLQTNNQLLISINQSNVEYVWNPTTQQLFLPFTIIKKIGTVFADKIVDERTKNGRFKSLLDFIRRMFVHGFTKSILKQLILANAFNEFNHNRATLIAHLEPIFLLAEMTDTTQLSTRQKLLKVLPNLKLNALADDWKINVPAEMASLDLILDYRFLENWMPDLKVRQLTKINFKQLTNLSNTQLRNSYLTGIIVRIETKISKAGQSIGYLWIQNLTGQIKVTVFDWQNYQATLKIFTLIALQIYSKLFQTTISYVLVELIDKLSVNLQNF